MYSAPVIKLEDDPVPIVKVIGAQLKRAMASDTHRRIVSQLDGCFSLSSVTDPQKVSVNINNNNIAVSRGINPLAKVVIHLDFNDAKIKPRIDGLLRYPLFAIKVGKLLEPLSQDWITEAKSYWRTVHDQPRMPSAIKMVATNDNVELLLGEKDIESEVTIYGEPHMLLALVNGTLVFAEAAMTGKINVECSVEHLAILTEVSIKRLLGEL